MFILTVLSFSLSTFYRNDDKKFTNINCNFEILCLQFTNMKKSRKYIDISSLMLYNQSVQSQIQEVIPVVKFRKILAVLSAALVVSSASAFPVYADADWGGTHNSYSKFSRERSPERGHYYGWAVGVEANTMIYTDIGWVTNCNVRSKGTSTLKTSKAKNTKNKAKLSKHTIKTSISGVGFGSINFGVSSGVGISTGSGSVEKVFNTSSVYYDVSSSIWRLFNYEEVHSGEYIVTVGKKRVATISASCTVKYL